MKPARVECYSGYRADERPLRFHDGEQVHEVAEILARWRDPDAEMFRVRADGLTWVLRHECAGDEWSFWPA